MSAIFLRDRKEEKAGGGMLSYNGRKRQRLGIKEPLKEATFPIASDQRHPAVPALE
jgi:hypothetical protein